MVFTKIPDAMALVQYTPHTWPEAQRVRQDLENDVAIRGAIPETAQCREAKRVGRVVG